MVPDLGFEFCDFGSSETAGALAVEGGGHFAVAELADEEFDGEGEGGEGFVAHGVVILFPAFVGLWGRVQLSISSFKQSYTLVFSPSIQAGLRTAKTFKARY